MLSGNSVIFLMKNALAALILLFSCALSWASEPEFDAPKSIKLSIYQETREKISDILMTALSTVGIQYRLGGNHPEQGLDCSGLVRYVFQQVLGQVLPRTSEEISRVGESVNSQDLQPGDLVFFNTLKREFSHVGIYLGESKFVHSPATGGRVRIENMENGYWKQRFDGGRRLLASAPEAAQAIQTLPSIYAN
jgi:cell wall-associated NlpC family hydrolase